MITSAKQLVDQGLEGKWIQVSAEEAKAIIESIPGENAVRGNALNANALRHYEDRGYIVVHGMVGVAERHPLDPLDDKAAVPPAKITGGITAQKA